MESNQSPLNTAEAASVFAELLDPTPIEEDKVNPEDVVDSEIEAQEEGETPEPEEEAVESEEPLTVTIKVDGKDVEVTLDELKNGYQRQADYTKKTMEVAEQRKAAEAEIQKAAQERNVYAQRLQEQTVILQNALQEQAQTDWQQLLDNDPVEYLKQQHLYNQRQAALQQSYQEQAYIQQLQQQEQAKYLQNFISTQQQELLAKLPDWKDEGKAKSDKAAIKEFLKDNGFNDDEIGQVVDHRHVLIARQAMLYRQMVAKAQTAAKKIQNVPQKVERPGTGTSPNLDKRSANFQRLSKTGSIDDAAAVFASIL